jgi:Cu2+-exporting ATPase
MRVSRLGKGAVLSTILDMLDQATAEKPSISKFADRVASRFVLAILLLATLVAFYWGYQGDPHWIAITISVLVVTCPCALSLATPVAMSAATARLTQLGLLTVHGHSIETLSQADHFVFDKTGTLTEGKMELFKVDCLDEQYDEQQVLHIAAQMEYGSEHPIAKAVIHAVADLANMATEVTNHPGNGVSARIDGQLWYLGKADFIQQNCLATPPVEDFDEAGTVIWLANQQTVIARLVFRDRVRAGARVLAQFLKGKGRKVSILSGDHRAAVQVLADDLGMDDFRPQALPEDKLDYIDQLQRQGCIVAMLGDGINDAPVLSRAQVSIAMGGGTQLASISADMVLLSDRLEHLIDALGISMKSMRIVKQNILWALIYNFSAIPAAALGYVPPWLAAIGMSASSLIVVANSLRILR